MNTITVQGMHCDACKKLIMIELEEKKLHQFVSKIDVDSDKKQGKIYLKNKMTEEDLRQMRSIIESMDGYSVS